MVKIDMDIPSSCYTCKLSTYDYNNCDGYWKACPILGDDISPLNVDTYTKKRHKDCPLIEVAKND